MDFYSEIVWNHWTHSDSKRLNDSTWIIKYTSWNTKLSTNSVYAIEAKVTCRVSEVQEWIQETMYLQHRRLRKHNLLVGLDTEWCLPSSENCGHQKVAIIQLCVGVRCLIFQLCHKDGIPLSLVNFLGDKRVTFVGKEIWNDSRKLLEDYGLYVENVKDVSIMASRKYDDNVYRRFGLRKLVDDVLGLMMEKPKEITMSEWDKKELSEKQIQYAAIDAFVSFKLGVELKKPIRTQ